MRRSSVTVHSKREQYVTRLTGDATVAGIHVHHAASDGGAAVVQRTARGGNAIHRIERLGRIEIPDHMTVATGVGA